MIVVVIRDDGRVEIPSYTAAACSWSEHSLWMVDPGQNKPGEFKAYGNAVEIAQRAEDRRDEENSVETIFCIFAIDLPGNFFSWCYMPPQEHEEKWRKRIIEMFGLSQGDSINVKA